MTSTGRDDNMIRECIKPGCIKYFADDDLCPACNDEGKFIMRGNERDSLARRLALALRHAPEKFDLEKSQEAKDPRLIILQCLIQIQL